MGCLEEKEKFEEESLLQYSEQRVIHPNETMGTLKALVAEFPRHMTKEEFEKGKSRIHVRLRGMTAEQVRAFDAYFRSEGELFDRTKLALLGLLLSTDDPVSKACFLFTMEEHSSKDFQPRSSLVATVSQLFDLSLEVLPACISTATTRRFPTVNCERYLSRLQAAKSLAQGRCLSRLVGNKETVRMDLFAEAVKGEEIQLSPHGLRDYTRKQCSAFWST